MTLSLASALASASVPVRAHSLRAASLVCALAAVLATSSAIAQTPAAPTYEPQRGQPGKDVMWIATPDTVVDRMLQMAELLPADRLVDLGSGDGKIPIAAVRKSGSAATGLEYNPKLVQLSIERAKEAGVADKTSFKQADIFQTDFSHASVVTMYLLPELNLRLRPILFAMAPGTRVVSHSFRMGDWQPDEVSRVGTADVYLWRIPANTAGQWRVEGSPDAPQTLTLTQRFQKVEGSASFGQLSASITQAQLSGPALGFYVRDGSGAMLRVDARITADRMVGTMTRAGGVAAPFQAIRSEPARPIEGVAQTQQEAEAAARALN